MTKPEDNQTPFNFPTEDSFDINRSISLFVSNWYWFAVALFISVSIAYAVNRYSEKVYTVSASLLIKDDQFGGAGNAMGSIVPGGDIFKSQQNLLNEMGILRSFMLNYKVMLELEDFHVVYTGIGRRRIVETRLYKTCPFKVTYSSLDIQPKGVPIKVEVMSDTLLSLSINGQSGGPWTVRTGERFNKMGFDFMIVPRFEGVSLIDFSSSGRYSFYFTDPESLANEYRGKLYVGPIEKEASLVNLSVSGFVREQESDYLNKLMDVYIGYGREYKTETATRTMEFIDDQIGVISDSLKKTEGKMASLRIENGFFDPTNEVSRIRDRFEIYDKGKADFDLKLRYYNYLTSYLESNNKSEAIISPSSIGVVDPAVTVLVTELATIQKDRSKLELNIEANQPAILLTDQQIEKVRSLLKENVKQGIEMIKLSISDIDSKISKIEEDLSILPASERKFIQVQREFDINNTVYTYLLEKRAETGIARASIVSDNREIDNASPYRASLIKPRSNKNYFLALLLGFLVPIITIGLIDFLNDKIIDKRDVENKTRVPVIGYISHNDGTSEIPVVDKPGSSHAESFRSIRTSLKYYIKDTDKPVIAISSTISSEGKTFVSVNLAAVFALLGKKVLIMGMDLRKPRLTRVFEHNDSPGLSGFLSGNCKFEEVIIPTKIKNLFYAPSGPVPPNPSELIETDKMKEFIDRAKAEYDYIVIDTPPIALVTDALLLAPYVDVNLFIVRQRYTSRNTLDIIEDLYSKGKLKHMSIIVNDINLSGYYGYGMRYKYSLGYRNSYGYNYYGKGYYSRYGDNSKTHGYYSDES